MQKKLIYIVEDDPDISELMQLVVEGEGFVVKTFTEGGLVKKNIENDMPSLVLMDLWVDGTDSVYLISNLKSKKKVSKIPLVIVSAKNALDKIAKRTGADGFLSKPFNIEDLKRVIYKFT